MPVLGYFEDNFNRTSPDGPGDGTAGTPDYDLGADWISWGSAENPGAVIYNNALTQRHNWDFHKHAATVYQTVTDDQVLEIPLDPTVTGAGAAFEIIFRVTDAVLADVTGSGGPYLDGEADGGIVLRVQPSLGTQPGQVTVLIDSAYQGPQDFNTTTDYDDGLPHLYRAEIEGNEVRLYIDSTLEFTRNDMGTLPSGSTRRNIAIGWDGGSAQHFVTTWKQGDFPLTPPPPEPPAAPVIWAIGSGHERIAAQWTTPDPGDAPIDGYDFRYATAAAPTTWITTTDVGLINYAAFDSLTNGTAYVMQVRAYSSVGDGDWSDTSGSATPSDARGSFLLESGDKFLLENGDEFLLEAGAGAGGTPGMSYWGFRMR